MGRTANFAPPAHSGGLPAPGGTKVFRETLQRFVQEIRDSGAEVMLCSQATLTHDSTDRSMWRHLGKTDEEAARTIQLGAWLRGFHAGFAEEHGVKFVDVYNRIASVRCDVR